LAIFKLLCLFSLISFELKLAIQVLRFEIPRHSIEKIIELAYKHEFSFVLVDLLEHNIKITSQFTVNLEFSVLIGAIAANEIFLQFKIVELYLESLRSDLV